MLHQPLEWSLENITNNVLQLIWLFLYIEFCQIIIYKSCIKHDVFHFISFTYGTITGTSLKYVRPALFSFENLLLVKSE